MTVQRCTLITFAALAALWPLSGCDRSRNGAPPAVPRAPGFTIEATSPLLGETGVAISREIRFRLSAPVDPTTVDAEAFQVRYAGGGPVIPSRLQVRRDGMEIMCFFPEQRLPPGMRIEVEIAGDRVRSLDGRALDADGNGAGGGTGSLWFETLSLVRAPGTDLCGRVLASERGPDGVDVPLAGVTISVDGLEGERDAVTDAFGNFCLQDTPSGRIFVHINGIAAAAPPGFYYPNVGKTWEARTGQPTSVGTIYLPAVALNALVATSATETTEIAMVAEQLQRVPDPELREALASVRLTVPPDNLFFDDGRRGNLVGLAPVDPARLPGRLPSGLVLPLVVTVQTDGATNFDLPVPIEFPNLPDPITGRPLAPGAKTALWSFDHDLGRFRIMGSMTVTADGSRVVSDPGVGLRAPGWHGWGLGNLLAALDITDCTQGNCNAQTNCVLLKDFLGVTKEIYGCISPVGRVAQVIGCGAAILNDTASAQASYNEFLSAWSNRSATAPVREWLDASFGIVQELRTTFGCLTEGFKPGDFDCAAATYSSIELFCTAGGLGSATPQGCPSNAGAAPQWVENVCDGIPVVSSTLAIGSSIYGFYEHPPDFSELGDRIDTILDSYGIVDEVLNIAEVLERPLTPTETRQIEATLAAIDTAFDDVDAALEGAGDAYDELNEALDSYQAMLDEVEQQVATLGQPVTGRFHYRAETRRNSLAAEAGTSPPNVVRGTTTENATVELNMNAESGYRVDFYDPIRGLLATSIGRTGGQGGRTEAATAIVIPAAELADTDGDGLPDDAEPIFGTDPTLPDTDGDTVSDLDEVLAGSDPTGNALAGVIARVSTDGAAIDVCVDNGLAAVITANDRLQVFNVFAGAAPSLLTTVALPGTPRDVACAGGFVLVALGSDGAVVVDPTASPPLVRPVLGLCASATSAAAADGSGYLGLDGSGLAIIDLASQTVVAVRDFPGGGEIRAISIAGRYAYAVTTRRLFAVDLLGDGTYPLVFDQYAQAAGFPVQSVFAGLDTLFVVHVAGFDRYSLTDPANPQLVDIGVTTRRGWKNMVTDGGQLAIAASADDSPLNSGRHDVARYDLSLPGNVWLGDIQTDGVARAVQLDAGIVFVADDANGLVVVRPFDADQANEAPMLTLETGFDPGTALPSGATALVRARASDNGLVQQVAFYLDDLLVAIDTSFPFEHRYRELPGGTDGAEHTLRVRATDTAGISTEQQLAVYVQPDTAGPTVIASTPATGGIAPPGSVVALSLRFDEPIDPVSLGSAGLVLLEAGPDGLRETGDDVPFALTAPQLDQQRFELSTASTVALPNGRFRLIAPAGGLRDDAGNGIDRTAIDFDAVAGLRVQFFAETDCHSRRSFFAGRDPVAFERYLPGRPVEVVAETVVSNIDFVLAPTPWLWSRGPDGVLQSSQVATPLGDDYALHALAGTRLGVRFEGYLHVPETGAVTFSANIDDDLTLAVDDVIVLDGVCCGLTTGDPIVLEAGVHRIRAGFVDYGGSAILQLYAEGAGLPGGVLPPAAFGF